MLSVLSRASTTAREGAIRARAAADTSTLAPPRATATTSSMLSAAPSRTTIEAAGYPSARRWCRKGGQPGPTWEWTASAIVCAPDADAPHTAATSDRRSAAPSATTAGGVSVAEPGHGAGTRDAAPAPPADVGGGDQI